MWVLGLVLMIDQVDQNIVRGVVTPLKADLGVSDLGIGILLTSYTDAARIFEAILTAVQEQQAREEEEPDQPAPR
jgi:hypothetical protein